MVLSLALSLCAKIYSIFSWIQSDAMEWKPMGPLLRCLVLCMSSIRGVIIRNRCMYPARAKREREGERERSICSAHQDLCQFWLIAFFHFHLLKIVACNLGTLFFLSLYRSIDCGWASSSELYSDIFCLSITFTHSLYRSVALLHIVTIH